MHNNKPIANQMIVLREDFDDWAILFDPDTAEGYTINPVGVFIWKKLDGKHTIDDIVKLLKENCEDIPDLQQLAEDVKEFIGDLVNRGLAGYEIEMR